MIRVATYNIRKAIAADRRRRPNRILEVLAEVDADIVALQEADRRFGKRASAIPPEMILAHSPYKPVPFDIRHGSIGWHGNAVLVRKSIDILHCQPLVLPALEPRGAVLTDLAVGGQRLRIVGMHLDLSGLWRRRQVRALIAQLAETRQQLPTVLMGDTNEWSLDRRCMIDFAAAYHVLPTGPSFHARHPVARLDRIIITPDMVAQATGVHHSALAQSASDHLPVWAEIALPG